MLRFLYRAAWATLRPVARRLLRGEGKVARAVRGRDGAARELAEWASHHRDVSRALVWFHAASVGEGRQAEAVLTRLRAARPQWQIAYTFASASAERFARSLGADFAGWVPADSPADVAMALDAVRPTALVFSATDLWPELALAAARRGVRLALISATLSPTSSRLGWLARELLGATYRALDVVGAVDLADAARLADLGVPRERIVVTGDTRHDAAAARAARIERSSPLLSALRQAGALLVVAGSTWPTDERALLPAWATVRTSRACGLVIAPHEPTEEHLERLERAVAKLPGKVRAIRLSALERGAETGERRAGSGDDPGSGTLDRCSTLPDPRSPWDICLVDRVGILADLYAVASVAYVGGGFHRAGLHAVIEPAALGVPVLFGPRWRGSRDARLLLERGGAASVSDAPSLAAALSRWLDDEAARAAAGRAARAVVDEGVGAADRSLRLILELVERSA